MSTFQVVAEKGAQIVKVTADFITQAAARLVTSAAQSGEGLSLEEMARRLDGALKALQGQEAPATSAPVSVAKTPLEIAKEIVDSYRFDTQTRVSTFTIPAGVSDVSAIKALNEYFRTYLPGFARDAVDEVDLAWYDRLSGVISEECAERDFSKARPITIRGVVQDTKGTNRQTQQEVLKSESLVFSDPRDTAIAAALHACTHDGADLFEGLCVRGSFPGHALSTSRRYGVIVRGFGDLIALEAVAASGSPSSEVK
jgi:hypothetical protein